ncbi:hypothetical protein MM239_12355 [Belliella sp. DSM 111904]|uniref:RES domain-containing protein n=1 Tax=Belliella filtrata TaxID=2923435 RepID=A0ABS9V1A2_9BACT|nr:hypothetical protein [Belliella filtrata]MCH7410191.1 hypothetical protein [Belliella filtrata]
MYLNRLIKILGNLNLAYDYYTILNELFRKNGHLPFMVTNYGQGKSLMRARPMYPNEPRFKNVSDFSFKPQKLNHTYQRASTPYQSMFYATTTRESPSDGEFDSARLISVEESMPWVRDENSVGVRKIAFARWLAKESLNLITIVHNSEYHKVNSYTKEVYEDFNKTISASPKDYQDAVMNFHKALAYEFSKEVNNHLEYQISAIFSEIMCGRSDIDGILYPSFRMEGNGLNVAIKPQSMYKLGLYVAGESIIYKNKKELVLGNTAIVQLEEGTEAFEMIDIENHEEECLNKIGVSSIEELLL